MRWSRVDSTTDADIARQIESDADTAPEFTEEMLARAEFVSPPRKVAISLRVDPDVLEFFRQQGPGYQSRMNAVLRGYAAAVREQASAQPRKAPSSRGRARRSR